MNEAVSDDSSAAIVSVAMDAIAAVGIIISWSNTVRSSDGEGGGVMIVVVSIPTIIPASHRYDTPHCPSPLKHCPGNSRNMSHAVHRPHPVPSSSKLSL
jgi:hypothetical protein